MKNLGHRTKRHNAKAGYVIVSAMVASVFAAALFAGVAVTYRAHEEWQERNDARERVEATWMLARQIAAMDIDPYYTEDLIGFENGFLTAGRKHEQIRLDSLPKPVYLYITQSPDYLPRRQPAFGRRLHIESRSGSETQKKPDRTPSLIAPLPRYFLSIPGAMNAVRTEAENDHLPDFVYGGVAEPYDLAESSSDGLDFGGVGERLFIESESSPLRFGWLALANAVGEQGVWYIVGEQTDHPAADVETAIAAITAIYDGTEPSALGWTFTALNSLADVFALRRDAQTWPRAVVVRAVPSAEIADQVHPSKPRQVSYTLTNAPTVRRVGLDGGVTEYVLGEDASLSVSAADVLDWAHNGATTDYEHGFRVGQTAGHVGLAYFRASIEQNETVYWNGLHSGDETESVFPPGGTEGGPKIVFRWFIPLHPQWDEETRNPAWADLGGTVEIPIVPARTKLPKPVLRLSE